MRLLIALLICWQAIAVPLATTCPDSLYCGSNLVVEKLACYGGRCTGAKEHNTNDAGKSCIYGYFRNSMNICQACITGCGTCTDAVSCTTTGCMSAYFYDTTTKQCSPLGTNCAQGPSASECTNMCEWLLREQQALCARTSQLYHCNSS